MRASWGFRIALALVVGGCGQGAIAPDAGGAGDAGAGSDAGDLADWPADAAVLRAEDAPDGGEWHVSKPELPLARMTLDTDRGTWMSVDVHPDGRTLVFDLLGDIYLLPIEGGDARPLTEGVAWDMQPRFSPDGRSVAFTSDRSGGDNVWVVGVDGRGAYAVTDEAFRLVNSPVWTPDGDFLAVRKHFTGTRSLGAGEVWLYHRFGGEGVAATARKSEQKDLGEPAFSPRGDRLYFSHDITSGARFAYDKDPHEGIYAISEIERRTGEISQVIRRPGGAVRPTPSPDGRHLAFVGRHGFQTGLFLLDLRSGAYTLLDDRLDRDLQETWAIHGVYPAMAFTPDGRTLVYWAEGQLFRIDVETKKRRPIPFRVRHHRDYVPQPEDGPRPDLTASRFRTKVHRHLAVSPDGRQVVYVALGKLYSRTLPRGTPERLTRNDEGVEAFPSFSRDGQRIVFVEWDDRALGHVYVMPRFGGLPRRLTRTPGHYVAPSFSPDGTRVVYRKTGAGSLRRPHHTRRPGLYVVPVSGGGPPRRISARGRAPHFGRASDRVYFSDFSSDDKAPSAFLKSIDIDGRHLRTHLKGVRSRGFLVSPDERWVALEEDDQAWITPFSSMVRTRSLGPNDKKFPVARLSRVAGRNVQWARGAEALYFGLGPYLFRQPLAPVAAALEEAATSTEAFQAPPLPPPVDISIEARADRGTGRIAFVGGQILTMTGTGAGALADGTVLVRDGRIEAVGTSTAVRIPSGTKRIDCRGKTVLPGFIDVHAHFGAATDGLLPEHNWKLAATLSFGVTTVHDPSHDTESVFAWAERVRAGRALGPRIFSTGTVLYGAKASIHAPVRSLADARRHIERQMAYGAFTVKSYNQPRRDQRQMIVAAARALGAYVVPEGGALFQHNMTMLVDGHRGIEHAIPLARGYRDVVALWSATGVGYTPTLLVAYGGINGEVDWYARSRVFEHPRLRQHVPPDVLTQLRRRPLVEPEDLNHRRAAAFAAELLAAGVPVQIGAHGQREGLGVHWELRSLAEGGASPADALRAATYGGARYLGLDHALGRIAPGKEADLIVVDGDPLQSLANAEAVRLILLRGRLYEGRSLAAVWPAPRPAPRPFWR